jgi:plastocyanin
MSKNIVALMMGLMIIGTAGVASGQSTDTDTQQDSELTTDCDVVISIAESGLAYDQTDVQIDVGDTVCWNWENESMAHNVAETIRANDDTRKSNGVYSGEANTTVDFQHTFNADTTFYYMCEPHVSMDMRGTITVGNGTVTTMPVTVDEGSQSVPGFGIAGVALAGFGALVFLRIETLRMIRPAGSRIPREI